MGYSVPVSVSLQGMDKGFVPNGSYDVIELGEMSLGEALSLLNRMPRSYPASILAMDEYCPASIIFENEYGSVLIALESDGSFYAIVNDFIRGVSNEEVLNLDLGAARELVIKYLTGEGALTPTPPSPPPAPMPTASTAPLSTPTVSVEAPIEGRLVARLHTRPEISVYTDRIDRIKIQDIYRVIIKKPGFLSKAKIIIEYRDPALNKIEKLEIVIPDKNQIPVIHQVLAQVLGPSRIILK